MKKPKTVKVEIDVVRKILYEFTVETVLDKYGDPDEEETKRRAAELYEQALDNGTLGDHYSDDDYEYNIGDIVEDDEYD